jgi:hypothetical protein
VRDESLKPLPVACELLPPELAARRASLLAELTERSVAREPTASGVRLTFAGDRESLELVFAAVAAERACCRFLRFTLTVEQDLGPLVLEIDGPGGTRAFLDQLFRS